MMPVLEQRLAHLFGFEYTVMLGRARSGLVALIETLNDIDNTPVPVLIPENICPALVTAIRAGGGTAITVPVSPENGLPDDQTFVRTMDSVEKPGIVSPTHLYGFLGDYPQTIKLARKKGWFILENDTNGLRIQSKESPFGDALLVSFGYAKPIEIGSGGALLTNDPLLAKVIDRRVSSYPLLDDSARVLEEETMLKRRSLRNMQGTSDQVLEQICHTETALSRFRFDHNSVDLLLTKLDQFPNDRARRCERRDHWDQALAPLDKILQPVTLKQPVPWRVIRRIPKGRNHFAQSLREHNIDAGINYRSLWRELPSHYLNGKPSSSDIWGDTVLNLWVTKDYDQAHIKQATDILMEAADEL